MQSDHNPNASDVIEYALWPESFAGWIGVSIFAVLMYFMAAEMLGFYDDFFKIHSWEIAQGNITDIQLNESGKKVHVTYKYKTDHIEYTGDKIGVGKLTWRDAGPREISNFRKIMDDSQPITIKYNPENHENSVYPYDSGDIIIVIFLSALQATLAGMFLFVCIRKFMRRRQTGR